MAESSKQELVYARASVHLPGLPLGTAALVDLSDQYIGLRALQCADRMSPR